MGTTCCVPSPVPRCLHVLFTSFNPHINYNVPLSQMRKSDTHKLNKVTKVTREKGGSQDSNPGCPGPEFWVLSACVCVCRGGDEEAGTCPMSFHN